MSKILNFNVDTYFNPIVPANQVKRLPKPVSHWLGYRSEGKQEDAPALIAQLFAFIGAFAGLLVVGAIYKYAPGINKFNPPVIIASLGASAVLEYNVIQTPLSQPRNTIVGQGLCAIIGVAISRAFQDNSDFENLTWVSGALACAIASMAMGLTNTINPPGGATAVLASVDAQVVAMGWWYVPVVLVGSLAMLGVALVTNNISRQFPLYWWTSEETGTAYQKDKHQDEEQGKSEKAQEQEQEKEHDRQNGNNEDDHDESASDTTLQHTNSHSAFGGIFISAEQLILPSDVQLSQEEAKVLKLLQSRLHSQALPRA